MFAEVEVEGSLLDVAFWDQCLLGLIVLTSALLLLTVAPPCVAWLLRPRRKAPDAPARGGESQDGGAAGAPDPNTPDDRPVAQQGGLSKVRLRLADRRQHPRREGPPTQVFLSDDRPAGVRLRCLVMDRSRSGLGIVVSRPLPPGAFVTVRPVDAPEDVPAVRIEVRSCRSQGREWYIGCRFAEELPWTVILLFG